MKKIIFLLMISAMGLNMTATAQKAINSVHFYDVKNAAVEKTYIASLKEINAIMIEIGFPNNYYTYMKLNESDTTSTYRSCTIGHWTSEQAYKAIHDHPKFKAWGAKNKDNNAVFITGQLYRKFYTVD
jgi:putative heme degradation protein